MNIRILDWWIAIIVAAAICALGCSPTVQVVAPTEPITINLNVKIEHEIVVRVDKGLDALFSEDDELF